MASGDKIVVRGLDDLRKAIRQVDQALVDDLKDEHKRIADMVAKRAQQRASATGRRNVIRAAETIRPARTAKGAVVRVGSNAVPWATAAQFGTHQDRQRTRKTGTYVGYRQFLPVKRGGYTIYPAIDDLNTQIVDEYSRALQRIITKAFPD